MVFCNVGEAVRPLSEEPLANEAVHLSFMFIVIFGKAGVCCCCPFDDDDCSIVDLGSGWLGSSKLYWRCMALNWVNTLSKLILRLAKGFLLSAAPF